MSIPPHPRILLAVLAACASLGSWGLAPIAARSPQLLTEVALGRLADACEQALRTRLPSRRALTVAPAPRVEAYGNGVFRLVSSFDAGTGRTSFACEATERGGSYEIGALTLVQW